MLTEQMSFSFLHTHIYQNLREETFFLYLKLMSITNYYSNLTLSYIPQTSISTIDFIHDSKVRPQPQLSSSTRVPHPPTNPVFDSTTTRLSCESSFDYSVPSPEGILMCQRNSGSNFTRKGLSRNTSQSVVGT